ncbi:MAG: sulfolactaldehyde 3-reductase [Geminicoccaceae bacterium]
MTDIGFIGLGVMGAPMAANLVRAGHRVRGFDLSSEALARARDRGVETCTSVGDAARDAPILITMLPTGKHVEAALFEDGVGEVLQPGALVIDMSTIMPLETDAIGQKLRTNGQSMVDAPVGRTSKHAEEGKLLIMAGGSDNDLVRARPLLEVMGDPVIHCGPPGAGSRAKIVNNYMSIASNVLTAESLVLAEKSGLARDVAIQVMQGTTAGQGHLGTTYPMKVLADDLEPGFMIDLAHKDMGLALDLAGRIGAPAAVGSVARQTYDVARAEGRGRQDWTAILRTVRRLAGLNGD